MNPSSVQAPPLPGPPPVLGANVRFDYLDATRAFALVLGVVFHASLSFSPGFIGWAVQDIATSPVISAFFVISHSFRMEIFFLLGGFFSHAAFHRHGVREFLRTRLLRIGVPFVVGWFILRPLIVSGWIMGSASLRGEVDIWTGLRRGFQSLSSLPAGIFTGSHLWFLYYLALLTAIAVAARGLIARKTLWHATAARWGDEGVRCLGRSRYSWVAFVIPTATSLWFMRRWGMDTPDSTLLPDIPVTLVYGSFFFLGWMLDRQRPVISRFAHLSWPRWAVAGVSSAGALLLEKIQYEPNHAYHTAAHVAFVVSYASMMWSLTFLTIGVFKFFCRRPRPWVRYVADSSYWLYLLHLPIVVWLQVAVAELPFHWTLKWAFISTVTLAVSLLSYDLWVRSTWLGCLLSGRRLPRRFGRIIT